MNVTKSLSLKVDTSFMVVDFEQVKENIAQIQKAVNSTAKILRPNLKKLKIPEIAVMQIEAGALDVCVQKPLKPK